MPRNRNSDLLRALGRRVARARIERGFTQQTLAEVTGLQPVSLSRLEVGDRALSVSTLAMIADALGIGLGHLVGIDEDLPKPVLSGQEQELLRGFQGLSEVRRDLVLRLVRELGQA